MTPTQGGSSKKIDLQPETTNERNNTGRSSSRASRCSLEVHERKILHMSKLRTIVSIIGNHIKLKGSECAYDNLARRSENTPEVKYGRTYVRDKITAISNERENQNIIRDRRLDASLKGQSKRSSASGWMVGLRSPDRRPSNSKRN